jgi:hypothetical protein
MMRKSRSPTAEQEPVSGEALVAAMQASPCREIDIEPRRSRSLVRDVSL